MVLPKSAQEYVMQDILNVLYAMESQSVQIIASDH